MFKREIENISERKFIGNLLAIFKQVERLSTIEWAEQYRILSSAESAISGKFDCNRTPAFEYLYTLCDNRYIHIVGCMKSSQVGASEVENNIIGRTQALFPCNTAIFFPGTTLLKEYSRKRLKPFFSSCKVLRNIVNQDVPKPSHDYFTFPGGSIVLRTLGSIQSVLSSPFPFVILEEFAQVKTEVAKQGDPLGLVMGRQKSFNIGMKKILAFSTPTFSIFCNMEKLYNQGFQLIFKAQCHKCEELIELSGWTMENFIKYDEYQDRFIDETYGKFNPETATFCCTSCGSPWTFEEKTQNIINGKRFGFIDDCGDFSLGWHPKKEQKEIITIEEYRKVEETIDKNKLKKQLKDEKRSLLYVLQYPEILSCFESTSNARLLAAKKLAADVAVTKGDETLIKDWYNNSRGLPWSSGIILLEAEDMKKLRSNYVEDIVVMEGLVLTAGIDVQDNRFGYVIRAHGRNNNSWLVKWEEIFGDVRVQEQDAQGNFLGVWGELTQLMIHNEYTHASGKPLKIAAVSIDSGDNTELVYNWVKYMNYMFNSQVYATKGTRDLRYSDNEIYREPTKVDANTDTTLRKTLAETMGVTVFPLGAHKAHTEILARVALNENPEAKSNIFYFNEQRYGQYEEQMTSCKKIVDNTGVYTREMYVLKPGKRKEAMDAEKNALHAAYAIGLRNYTHEQWRKIEEYLYADL